jgi:hypothetical protein
MPGGPEGDCHEWQGPWNDSGYGVITVDGKLRGAHRVALILATGREEPGKVACHTCDNPPCCNPVHLYFGTRKQNAQDAVDRHRLKVGSQRKDALLDEEGVLAIRERFAAGERTIALSDEYNVAMTTITSVVRGRKWRHVGGPIVPAGTPKRPSRRWTAPKREAA